MLRASPLLVLLLGVGCAPTAHEPARGPAHQTAPHWSYQGADGPDHWAGLSPAFAPCASGHAQSPVDLAGAVTAAAREYRFDYAAQPPTVTHNGHTVQVNHPAGSTLTIDGESFALLQYHFHTPSEHTLDGVRHPMELHLVHRGDSGLAVLGVLIRAGREHPAYGALSANLPTEAGEERAGVFPLNPLALLSAPGQALRSPVYRYAGSLTTPPCAEGVRWHLLAEPVELSAEQIARFQQAMGMNSRPVQPLHGRAVVLEAAP